MRNIFFLFIILFASCKFKTDKTENNTHYEKLLIGSWICDSIVQFPDNVTYTPDNNAMLFYNWKNGRVDTNNRNVLIISSENFYTTRDRLIENIYYIKDSNIIIKQPQFKDTLVKKIILVDSTKMIIEEKATLVNNQIWRGDVVGKNKIRLYYKRKNTAAKEDSHANN